MRLNQKVISLFILLFFLFISISMYYMTILSAINSHEQKLITSKFKTANSIEVLIQDRVNLLPRKYKVLPKTENNFIINWLENIKIKKVSKTINYKDIWNSVTLGMVANKIYHKNSEYLGTALAALQNATIKAADVDSRGSQLKILLTLEGDQRAVFKPQWYRIDRIISGPIYSGKDRYNAEILAFYLAGLLNFCSVPLVVERSISLEKEIIPKASERLKATIDKRNGSWCVYGICHYCRPSEPACSFNGSHLTGALIWHLPKKLQIHRSPWGRKYRGSELALWQVQNNCCQVVMKSLSENRILDLVDAAIFDFLMQNGDRHHYETINGKLVLLDNGKGLGNPKLHHLDILAPLYQCCKIRLSTWKQLLSLSGGKLVKLLKLIPEVIKSITTDHLNALEERLLLIYTTVEMCFSQHTALKVLKH